MKTITKPTVGALYNRKEIKSAAEPFLSFSKKDSIAFYGTYQIGGFFAILMDKHDQVIYSFVLKEKNGEKELYECIYSAYE